MNWQEWLAIASNVAQAATGLAAVSLWFKYVWAARRRKKRLEEYLADQKQTDGKGQGLFPLGRRTVVHLMGNLSMTETQIFEAAFSSTKIKTKLGTDEKTGRADTIFFEPR